MQLQSNSFKDGDVLPGRLAFGVPAASEAHVAPSDNLSPHLAWSGLPAGTRSLALICHDPDAPTTGDDVNKEGRSVSAKLPRTDFYHWVLFNLPARLSGIDEGEFSRNVTPHGKSGPHAVFGSRQGINDFTAWFSTDEQMKGTYFGYDGPCPPWNDEIPHRYVFTLYALDVDKLKLDGAITGPQLLEIIKPHVIGQASISGRYSLNPSVKL